MSGVSIRGAARSDPYIPPTTYHLLLLCPIQGVAQRGGAATKFVGAGLALPAPMVETTIRGGQAHPLRRAPKCLPKKQEFTVSH